MGEGVVSFYLGEIKLLLENLLKIIGIGHEIGDLKNLLKIIGIGYEIGDLMQLFHPPSKTLKLDRISRTLAAQLLVQRSSTTHKTFSL